PLLALPPTFGHVRRDDAARGAPFVPAAGRRRAAQRLRPGRRPREEGLLLDLRLEPLRRAVAGGRAGLDSGWRRGRRPRPPPAAAHLRRVARSVGRAAGRRPAALR